MAENQVQNPPAEKVIALSASLLEPFQGHPFRVASGEEMEQLKESIREYGVLSPLLVRPREDGRYEIVSGHRRKAACEALGITELPVLVWDMTDDEAVILMVDSNIQREHILPSEKAFAYLCMDAQVGAVCYFSSCSRSLNKSEWKNSSIVIPRPSHSFLMVETVALRFRPLMMLLTVDCVTPLMLHSLLMEMFCSWHSSRMRSLTASPMFKGITSLPRK